jgi:hypothetical protein
METRFAFRNRESYPARRRRAPHSGRLGGMNPPACPSRVTSVICGAKVTPVSNCADRSVILSQRTWCAGKAAHGTSEEIRCAFDLILTQGERMDG